MHPQNRGRQLSGWFEWRPVTPPLAKGTRHRLPHHDHEAVTRRLRGRVADPSHRVGVAQVVGGEVTHLA
jgi:hypothetical protein